MGLTNIECQFYETMPRAILKLTDEVKKLREAVEKCTGRKLPDSQEEPKEEPAKEEHPADGTFDILAVTDVQVFPFKDGVNLGHMKGMASVVLNDQIQLRGLRIMSGENGLFVGYPTDPFYKGEDYRSIIVPVTRKLREHIENCVLEKYQEAIK